MPGPAPAQLPELLDQYDGVLVDAYGVLCDSQGALPGAAALIEALQLRGRPWAVVTNDASRLADTVAARLERFGVAVAADHVITSGSLLPAHFAAHGLVGRRCAVLGPADSVRYVEAAGGVVVHPADRGAPLEAIVVCDDAIDPFLPTVEATLGAAVAALDAGVELALVLPNPDLVYPRGAGEWGLTAGTIAAMIETALHRLRPGAPCFVALGKPHAPMYAEARRRVGPGRVLAIGDQLDTDIAGALAAGMDAALVASGVSRWRPGLTPEPTWLLDALTPARP